jgi:hypothetical protein
MSRIISISRRTDIPAFHGDWFMERLAQGFAGWENPFAGQRQLVSLHRDDVACLAFWSKNFSPFLPHLRRLKAEGWPCFFNFTITGQPQVFEPRVSPAAETIEVFKEISALFSPAHLVWRYDPVLVSEWTPPEYHLARFAELADALAGSTTRCVISFPTRYGKVERNFARFERENGCRIFDPALEERRQLAAALAEIAAQRNMILQSCCEDSLVSDRITQAHCMDGETISRLHGCACRAPVRPNRPQCGCAENVDIGRYNTCPHGCVYCYANTDHRRATLGYASHDPRAAFFGRTLEESNRFLAELRATEAIQLL